MINFKSKIILILVSLFCASSLNLKQTMLSVERGEVLTITVRSNSGTGYWWYCDNAAQLERNGYLKPLNLNRDGSSKDNVTVRRFPGSPQNTLFKFRAIRNIRIVRVILTLKRPWNESDKTTREYLLDII